MSRKVPGFLPQVSCSILLALSLRPRHGYELMQQIEEDSLGKIKLGPGALYGSIRQLREDDMIEEMPDMGNDRRRYYRITPAGRKRLGAELQYFEKSVSLARQRQVFDNPIIRGVAA
ncbi:MAG TPA: PadR family transcriptional regulator [Candidatus Saccharimonadales bacterium]|jgi:DNA-binding PadR family transcriptional regulator|nr:PadR family transcriptional regulator [Candidatus Saccharimonadales bacterium]